MPSTHIAIGEISATLARAVGWTDDRVELLRLAAPMHDVGKIGIPDRILLKPGPLTPAERIEMERHTVIGNVILSGSDSELLDLAATIALTHHERIDGTGYPARLRGEEIPEAGRIVAVADVFDALTNDRIYRRALPRSEAIEVMCGARGSQFDPVLVDALLGRLDDVLMIEQRSHTRLMSPGADGERDGVLGRSPRLDDARSPSRHRSSSKSTTGG